MGEFIIRVFSFFMKEINEIRRQPRLILSLILGPFLILLLFGAGYRSDRPIVRTLLVVPEDIQAQMPIDEIRQVTAANFELVGVQSDPVAAMEQLRRGEVDLVEILPGDVQEQVLSGTQSLVQFTYSEINPINEQWIQYLGYAQVSEINRALLLQTARQAQGESGAVKELLAEARADLTRLQAGISQAQRLDIQATLRQLREALDVLAVSPLLVAQTSQETENVQQAREQVLELRDDLTVIEEAIEQNRLDEQAARIATARQRITDVEKLVELFSTLPPEVIVSPLQQTYQNLRGSSLDLMTFYAPGVLMLILQHIAVTLGALSLVRERMLGALELYRVSPVSVLQILLGKYLGYTFVISVIASLLLALMYWGLRVPFLGNSVETVELLLLFTLAALGFGFVISVLSQTDSQAVQLSMLVLLLSVFFGGFLLPLENFWEPVRIVGYMLPLSHGIIGAQDILLRGNPVSSFTWAGLAILAAVTFLFVLIGTHAQFRRAA